MGLEGNERADQLAKEAAMYSRKRPDYDLCPISYVKRGIRCATLDEWNRRYKTDQTAGITKIFFPDALEAYRTVRKIETTNLMTQVMTGHGGFSEYLSRFGCKESPSCVCDPTKDESVPHMLLECPIHDLDRLEVEQRLDRILKRQIIHEIMKTKDRDIFLKFCTKIASKVIARNKT